MRRPKTIQSNTKTLRVTKAPAVHAGLPHVTTDNVATATQPTVMPSVPTNVLSVTKSGIGRLSVGTTRNPTLSNHPTLPPKTLRRLTSVAHTAV